MTSQHRPAVTAVLIPVGEPPRIVDLPRGTTAKLHALQALCQTRFVEPAPVTRRWEAWVAENGIAEGQPVNPAATILARACGQPVTLHGPAVITGLRATRGSLSTVSLPPGQVEAILAATMTAAVSAT